MDTDFSAYQGEEVGFFENKVFDDEPEIVYAEHTFTADTDDSARVSGALNRARKEENGGVVILRVAQNTDATTGTANNRFSLAHIPVPANVRIEIEPEVVLEMRGNKETSNVNRNILFSIGRSNGPGNLLDERVENVEITSTDPSRSFTIDATTNNPIEYGNMTGGNGGGLVNLTRAVSFAIGYARNFAVSNVVIQDNYTENVSVQLAADHDNKDGAFAWRFGSKPVFLQDRYDNQGGANNPMNPINIPLATNSNGDFIDDDGNIVPDMFAIQRNPTYGRTPIKGSIKNIKAINVHTGYGAVQVYGGDWVEIDNIEAVHGVGVRIEAGNGTTNDKVNRSGPYYSSANKIKISNIKLTKGFTAVWLKTHSKIMKDISVENVEAIDSGSALLIGKGSYDCKGRECRDLTRGRINNVSIKGDIILRQTIFDQPVAEVGNLSTYLLSLSNREYLAAQTNKSITQISRNDIAKTTDKSGERWYYIFPVAPVLALSQLSATEIGDESAVEGFFGVDYSQANIVQDGLALGASETKRANILYRGDMQLPNGGDASSFIYK
ncbi:hypothetical protein DS2_12048 [Catenovulum agarivorans DS-2]|uniref:Uncharacterized protein n=2 Tax=Catenovulum agarivorans TaxID=1172192 RepID=W7QNT2_9ALTE|nr:hypothetical protein DS2_12048 [Catenovulum agarivorans DS-2]